MPSRHDYRIGWICALPVELAAAQAMLDATHSSLPNVEGDRNVYILGSIGGNNVVITCLPAGIYGTSAATATATQMRFSYRYILCCLLVGIGGGAPSLESDIRLGDVVVSEPTLQCGGVIQYDHGKAVDGGHFVPTGTLDPPPDVFSKGLARLKAHNMVHGSQVSIIHTRTLNHNPRLREIFAYPGGQYDRLFVADYSHIGSSSHCEGCDLSMLQPRHCRPDDEPRIFYGLVASGNKVIRDAKMRDQLAQDHGIICFEMEAAGLMNTFPSLIVRGICDYSDSHKNKRWQGYAAMMAAAYAKELIQFLPSGELEDPEQVFKTPHIRTNRQALGDSISTFSPGLSPLRPNDIPDPVQTTLPEPRTSNTSTIEVSPDREGDHEFVPSPKSSKSSELHSREEPQALADSLSRDPISAYLDDSDSSDSSNHTLQPRYTERSGDRKGSETSCRLDSYAENDHHYVVFYHVKCSRDGVHANHKELAVYLDHPRLFKGDSKMSALRGQKEIEDVPKFLKHQEKVVFIVNKWLKCVDHLDTAEEFFHPLPTPNDPEIPESVKPYFFVLPKHSSLARISYETMELVSETLRAAVAHEMGMDYHQLAHLDQSPNRKLFKRLMYYASRSENRSSFLAHDDRLLFDILLGYMESTNSKEYEEVDRLLPDGLINEKYLLSLYGPRQILVSNVDEHPRAYMVERALINRGSITLKLWFWQFNGIFSRETLEWNLEWSISMPPDRPIIIASLELYPLKYACSLTLNRLRTRGRILWNCRRARLVAYDCPSAGTGMHERDSRFMVDAETYQKVHGVPSDFFPEQPVFSHDTMQNDEPPHDFALLLPHEIHGFGLSDKKWRTLLVEHIKDINWNERAFDRLVLSHGKKELIKALATSHTQSAGSSDIIEGKGNALVMLFHGCPGTGKTLTAEAVAELTRRPLYRLKCGDIGTGAEAVEKHLESVLLMCSAWGCVVLLDEADVFLEQRRETDLQRNALVSVFLRVLEYYEGILILTTNRVGTLDSAFKSRFQLAVHYPTLDFQGRYEIWLNFINDLSKTNSDVNIDDLKSHIQELSAVELNGRQIRNTVSTSLHLAQFCQTPLNYEHFKQIIGVTEEFEKHFESTRGYSDIDWAGDRGI
ncbi:uncharacterized protein LDX57_006866 [Aspergillus melleus]|uniref:uncharacterized protein n=1 Tax=Aspergillus melleus TaxID=138277 RepID=UPI001E8CDB5B|nr:uncharacterized protein LDX57_006866 [Aspergillus melleus]KAH8429197.1 hypothetical protein LDX57_006866 [Aspergillus melleus]